MRSTQQHSQRGFTLIELMVVVAILSVLAAIVVTATLRLVNRNKKLTKSVKKTTAVAQLALQVRRIRRKDGRWVAGRVVSTAVQSTKVDAALKVHYVLERAKVVPVYHADFQGRYTLLNASKKPLRAVVYFPFPRGAGTFSDIQFLVTPKQSPSSRPTTQNTHTTTYVSPKYGLDITPSGVQWSRHFAPEEIIKVKIRYKVRGRDLYRYRIAPGKKRAFSFKLKVEGVDPDIPSQALQPSNSQRLLSQQNISNLFTWSFQDFLSTEDIIVKFPPQFSKYYRYGLLGRLGGIALLFFAIFFWFFGERQKPDTITRTNFFLLLLCFASFFPMLIFLEEHTGLYKAFSISLITACFLTTYHTSTFMGWRWAFKMSLPFQLFFTVGFTFAVLLPTYRPLAFTIGAVLLVAFIIVYHARYQKERAEREALEEEERIRTEEAQREEAKRLEASRLARLKEMEETLSTDAETPLLVTQLQGALEEEFFGEAAGTKDFQASSGLRVRIETTQGDAVVQDKEGTQKAPKSNLTEYCLFCGTHVDPEFKHCYGCGSLLQRTYDCPGCDEEYWYPSVESFNQCRKCGTALTPPPSPLKE
ncbi:MAG: hypothetical protein CL932_05295 [Deltaproteobacteria bacterium]|nr:hypothetical protein [Deltaproteobacteria bacterium]